MGNNRQMDKLIDKLGYMDYRDALALNRYILEAKRHGDYQQKARTKTLSLALSGMSRLKREQYDKKVSLELKKRKEDKDDDNDSNNVSRDQTKLDMMMAEDSVVA